MNYILPLLFLLGMPALNFLHAADAKELATVTITAATLDGVNFTLKNQSNVPINCEVIRPYDAFYPEGCIKGATAEVLEEGVSHKFDVQSFVFDCVDGVDLKRYDRTVEKTKIVKTLAPHEQFGSSIKMRRGAFSTGIPIKVSVPFSQDGHDFIVTSETAMIENVEQDAAANP